MSLNKQQTEEALWNAKGEEERAWLSCAPVPHCPWVPAPNYSIQDPAGVRMAGRSPSQGTSLPWHSLFQPRVPQAGASDAVTGPHERNLGDTGLPRLFGWASISLCLGWPACWSHSHYADASPGLWHPGLGFSLMGGSSTCGRRDEELGAWV